MSAKLDSKVGGIVLLPVDFEKEKKVVRGIGLEPMTPTVSR